MKIEDFNSGEIGVYEASDHFHIFEAPSKRDGACDAVVRSSGRFEIKGRVYDSVGNVLRKATPNEIEHFMQCREAGKYVPYIENKELYPLLFN